MKTLNYVKILLLCVFTIGLASCGDDVYYTMQNSDDKLCDRSGTRLPQHDLSDVRHRAWRGADFGRPAL